MDIIESIGDTLECIPTGKNCVVMWVHSGKLWSETVRRTKTGYLVSFDPNGKEHEFHGFHKDQKLTIFTIPEIH